MTEFNDVIGNTPLTRTVPITLQEFRMGVTSPTFVAVGTTPSVPCFLFDSTAELINVNVVMPQNWDHTKNASLDFFWAIEDAGGQTNDDELSLTMDYVVPINAGDSALTKTNTQILATKAVTTAEGLDQHDVVINFALPSADADNPFSDQDAIGFYGEFHMTNLDEVASFLLTGACLNYEALR